MELPKYKKSVGGPFYPTAMAIHSKSNKLPNVKTVSQQGPPPRRTQHFLVETMCEKGGLKGTVQ